MHTRHSPAAVFSLIALGLLVCSIIAPSASAQLGAVLEREQGISASATTATPTGAYAGTFIVGDSIKLQLRNETGGAYTGALTTPKGQFKVAAAVYSNRLVGRIDSGNATGDYAEFTGRLDGDSFEMTLNGKVYVLDRATPATVGDAKRKASQSTSTRQPQQEQPQQEQPQRQIDRRLIGRWISEDIYLSGDFSYSSQTSCILKSDGTYEYFSGGSGASSNAGTITRSGGGRKSVITGIWRTENGSLYTQPKGSSNWGCVGQYSFDGEGNNVLVRSGNSKVLWEKR